MDHKRSRKSDQALHAEEIPDSTSPLSRRSFLKASAIGAGALAVPAIGSSADSKGSADGSGAASQTAIDYRTQSDTWVEPWEFVQKDWPGQSLHLDVVEHAAPVAVFGNLGIAEDANVGTFLFSWNGISPAPTVRVGTDETLFVNVRNMLGPNDTTLLIPNGKVPPKGATFTDKNADGEFIYVVEQHDFCRPIHSNHKKQIHTTNLHFHGSHVSPYLNPDGTRSDDIFLRIVPQGDYQLRQTSEDPNNPGLQNPVCWPLKGSEVMGQQQYQYRLGKQGGARENHPPGTHWYHPHAHGSTYTQVAGGMAGLVIVEGDVDEALKEQLTDDDGNSFNERAVVLQRIVGPAPVDIEDNTFVKDEQPKQKSPAAFPTINGQSLELVDNYIVLAPEVVERWRVLNAGVDGQAYLDLLVLDLVEQTDLVNELQTDATGALTGAQTINWKYRGPRGDRDPVTLTISIPKGGNSSKNPITWTRSNADGTEESGKGANILNELYEQMEEYLYTLKGGTMHHLASDGITLVNEKGDYHTRPVTGPMMMSPANRMDFLFQAPALAKGSDFKLLSFWIRQNMTGSDAALASAGATGTKILQNVATIITRGQAAPPPTSIDRLKFPPVPGYLKPVSDQEITVRKGDPDYDRETVNSGSRSNNNGKRRHRRVLYSGWGGGGFPAGDTNRLNELAAFYRIPQEFQGSAALGGVSGPESMMIDCRKFNDDPNDLEDIAHHMLLNTAEEWTVSNLSLTRFEGDPEGPPVGVPNEYDRRRENIGNAAYPSPQKKADITTRAVDHPFHIHINPCWVVGIYDWEGKRLNWNYEREEESREKFYPRWHDVVRMPRMGGWIVFRSRFWDFDGEYVHHCHILQHEDNGMMQGIAVVRDASQADYVPFDKGQRFPKPTWKDCYLMDWGLGGTQEQGEKERMRLMALRAKLRTPVSG